MKIMNNIQNNNQNNTQNQDQDINILNLPEEILDIIVKNCNQKFDNNIPYKFPFTKYFESNLMLISNKYFNQKYRNIHKTKGYYIDILCNNKYNSSHYCNMS